MARVFISHATPDLAVAVTIRSWLRDTGHQVFLARDLVEGIRVGEEWKRRLHRELRAADAVVCVVTPAFAASQWCAAEAGIADMLGCPILPVLAGFSVEVPLLDGLQYTDFGADPARARGELTSRLRGLHPSGGVGWSDGRSPFPGLRPFDVGMARVFFGRSPEILQLTKRLRSLGERADGGLLLVSGASGCGKSSLVRAGLIPQMASEPGWQIATPVVPGRDPVAALGRALAATANREGLGWTVENTRRTLAGGDGGLTQLADELLISGPGPARERLLLVVDQAEELFTSSDDEGRARFAELLRAGLAGPVRVVATVRSEFCDRLAALTEWSGVSIDFFPLRPLGEHMLRRVVEEPAAVAGLQVDAELVNQLVADTAGGEALPLLAFTLQQLAEGLTRGNALSTDRYVSLGGVAGALARHADTALLTAVRASGLSSERVLAGLARLAALDSADTATRRKVSLATLNASLRVAFDSFVEARLLTTVAEPAGTWVSVTHEALFTAWPPLAAALRTRTTSLRENRLVEQAAAEWRRHDNADHYLWNAQRLQAALTALGLPAALTESAVPSPAELDEVTDLDLDGQHFLRAGAEQAQAVRSRERRRRARTVSILSALLALALVLTVVTALLGVDQRHRATRERLRAEEARQTNTAIRLTADADAARDSNPRLALQLGVAALSLTSDQRTRASATASLVQTLTTPHLAGTQPLVGALDGDGFPLESVDAIAFSPGGTLLAVGGHRDQGLVRLWDIADPARPRVVGTPLTGFAGQVASVAFSRDGKTLATGSTDDVVRLWNLTDPTHPRVWSTPLRGVSTVAFAPDGRTLATGGYGDVRLWNVLDPAHPEPVGGPLQGHSGRVESVAFSPDRRTLASLGTDGTARLWDVTHPAQVRAVGSAVRVDKEEAAFGQVAFAADSQILAVGSGGEDETVQLWDIANRGRPRSFGKPIAGESVVGFSPRGTTMSTGNSITTAQLWDVADASRPQRLGDSLRGHPGSVSSVQFSPKGDVLATGGLDGWVLLWRTADAANARPLGPPVPGATATVNALAFSPDGQTLAAGAEDGTVRRWSVADPSRPASLGEPLPSQGHPITALGFIPDSRTLVTSSDEALSRWDVSDQDPPHLLTKPPAGTLSPDGRILLTADSEGTTVRLWNVGDPAHPRPWGAAFKAGSWPVTFSPNSHTLATGGEMNATIQLWNVTDPVRPRQMGAPLEVGNVSSVAFSPDGRTLAVGNNAGGNFFAARDSGTVRLWDLSDPGQPRSFSAPWEAHTLGVSSLSFSADGRTLATASAEDSVARLWDVTDAARPHPLGAALTRMTSVAFSPDGRTLGTASADHSIRLWDVGGIADLRRHATSSACDAAKTGLDRNTWRHDVPYLTYRETCPR